MHHSLLISEILVMIFSSTDHQTLSRLARTCKLFHDPALSLLWRHQRSLVPLLKSMPPDLWEETATRGLCFRRPLISTDLEAFNKFAWRIISIRYTDKTVDVGTLEALSNNMPTTLLLPNLRKFTGVLRESSPIYPFMGLFLGDRTEAINIFLSYPDTSLSYIPSIKTRCPAVRDLTLRSDIRNLRVIQTISDLVCEYAELESLDVIGLTSHALAHIATYSALRCLKLGDLRVKDIYLIKGSGIAQVSELEITTTEDAVTLNSFLLLVHPQQLQELSLTLLHETSPPTLWQQCFQTLSQCCSATLKELHIAEGSIRSNDVPRHAMDYPILERLLPFQHLTSLTLFCASVCELDDDGLRRMAMAWPRLEALSLQTSFEDPIQVEVSQITLRGLVPLLEYCPELTELDIVIDASVVEHHLLRLPGRDVFNDKIVSMTVGNSVINDAASVAAFFSHFLPGVRHIISWEQLKYIENFLDDDWEALREARQYYSRWIQVPDLMKVTKVVRKQETPANE